MKKLVVKALSVSKQTDLATLSELCDQLADKHEINTINWQEYNHLPDVKFVIGYTKDELVIKYYVAENSVRAVNSESNGAVYQDSCVEFFVSVTADGPYTNFEFNAIGTCLSQRGMSRGDRQFLPASDIQKIRRWASLGTETFEEKPTDRPWELLVAIPFTLVFGNPDPELKGKIIRANFYKCGDKMSQRHYLSWNPIGTERPDFHRPEFFGVLEFE